MEFRWEPEYEAFRIELSAFIQERRTPELLREYAETYGGGGELIRRFHEEIDERGWMKMCWPTEYGGEGRSMLYQYLFVEEMEYWGMPYGNLTFTSIAPSILAWGNEDQKKEYLPGIFRGELVFALGYSEPNAGTDLASLRTRAERDGDEWVINGQKIWTSLADVSTHIWLAVRTDPDARKHAGISIIIVPTDTPGVTIRPLYTMYGGHTNETFYDDVRVPVHNVVGEVNRGWPIIMHALNHERVGLAATGGIARIYDQLVEYLRAERPERLEDPVVRRRLAELQLEIREHRVLALQNAWIISQGRTPIAEASMAKISATELRTRLASAAMDILGRYGGLSAESGEHAPFGGRAEWSFRLSPIFRFGGGTNEVMRDIVAAAGLGLAR
ncbi:MAG: acyl-CoA dehydrogenase family protein [Deltaproteobacteria bacterium]|nr:acyl-CoA dehydrogenase family protein [Deltaproteobacteria bacterium]